MMRIRFSSKTNFAKFCILLSVIDSVLSSDNNKSNSAHQNVVLSPVILIPGLGGNKLQAKLNKATVPHLWCSKKSDYFDIWLNLYEMLPNELDCWIDNIKLTYNNITRKTQNTAGVDIALPQWGGTESIEWIDTRPIVDHLDSGAYFHHIVQALTNRGYRRGVNLFGAPYDFRKGPNENEDWFERLVHLTEYAYKMNNNTRVSFLLHSMGGRMLLHFLQEMPHRWKDHYVKRVIALSVPWGGSAQALVALSIGDNLNARILSRMKMKQVQETFPSIVWLMPSTFFWKSNEVLAVINGTNYTLANIDQFFRDIDMPSIIEMRKDLEAYHAFTAPGVELHCLFGNNVDTVERLNFGTEYNAKPILIKGNGDGVVNERSLRGYKYWENTPAQRNHRIYSKEFEGIDHLSILHSAGPINYIIATLTRHQDHPRDNEHWSGANIAKIQRLREHGFLNVENRMGSTVLL